MIAGDSCLSVPFCPQIIRHACSSDTTPCCEFSKIWTKFWDRITRRDSLLQAVNNESWGFGSLKLQNWFIKDRRCAFLNTSKLAWDRQSQELQSSRDQWFAEGLQFRTISYFSSPCVQQFSSFPTRLWYRICGEILRQVFGPSFWPGKRHQTIARRPRLLADLKTVEEDCDKNNQCRRRVE